MPLTEKGQKIMANMQREYGPEKGERVFYASRNKGIISGVDPGHARGGLVAGLVNHDFDPDLPRLQEDARLEPVAQLSADYARVIQQLREGARQAPAVAQTPVAARQRGGGVDLPAKHTQGQVNYRRGYPLRQCGVCVMYWHRHTHQMYGGCTAVEGNITPYGLCDLFYQLRNPFGHKMHRDHRAEMEKYYDRCRGEGG